MNDRNKIIIGLVLALSIIVVSVVAMSNTTINGEVRFSGEIIADDGFIYIIAGTEIGDKLASMVGETVTVAGSVQEVKGERFLTVKRFAVIPK
jgi:hypothetical protein